MWINFNWILTYEHAYMQTIITYVHEYFMSAVRIQNLWYLFISRQNICELTDIVFRTLLYEAISKSETILPKCVTAWLRYQRYFVIKYNLGRVEWVILKHSSICPIFVIIFHPYFDYKMCIQTDGHT